MKCVLVTSETDIYLFSRIIYWDGYIWASERAMYTVTAVLENVQAGQRYKMWELKKYLKKTLKKILKYKSLYIFFFYFQDRRSSKLVNLESLVNRLWWICKYLWYYIYCPALGQRRELKLLLNIFINMFLFFILFIHKVDSFFNQFNDSLCFFTETGKWK